MCEFLSYDKKNVFCEIAMTSTFNHQILISSSWSPSGRLIQIKDKISCCGQRYKKSEYHHLCCINFDHLPFNRKSPNFMEVVWCGRIVHPEGKVKPLLKRSFRQQMVEEWMKLPVLSHIWGFDVMSV